MLDFGVQGLTFWLRHPASGPGSNINATYALGLPSEDAANTTELLLTRPVVFLHGVGWGLVRHPILSLHMLVFCVVEQSSFLAVCPHLADDSSGALLAPALLIQYGVLQLVVLHLHSVSLQLG